MVQWWILGRDGRPVQEANLPERPQDANLADGEAFRPWYKQDEHLHTENGSIAGIHARGTLESVQEKLKGYIARESEILTKHKEDTLLSEV